MSMIVMFEQQKIITKSKTILIFEAVTHLFSDFGSKACSLVLIPLSTKNNRAYSNLVSKLRFQYLKLTQKNFSRWKLSRSKKLKMEPDCRFDFTRAMTSRCQCSLVLVNVTLNHDL